MDREFLFARDILKIDGVEYGRFDFQKIKERFEGEDKSDPDERDLAYYVYGYHKVLDFDANAFVLNYDRDTERINECSISVSEPFEALVRFMEELGLRVIRITKTETFSLVLYQVGRNKEVAIHSSKNYPEMRTIILRWKLNRVYKWIS